MTHMDASGGSKKQWLKDILIALVGAFVIFIAIEGAQAFTQAFQPGPVVAQFTPVVLAEDTFKNPSLFRLLWKIGMNSKSCGGQGGSTPPTKSLLFTVNQAQGLMLTTHGPTGSCTVVLNKAARNEQIVITGTFSKGGALGAYIRWVDANNWYRAIINGSTLVLQASVHGKIYLLATIPFVSASSISPVRSEYYMLSFRAVNSMLALRVWREGGIPPLRPQLVTTDTRLRIGTAGIFMSVGGGKGQLTRVKHVTVTTLP